MSWYRKPMNDQSTQPGAPSNAPLVQSSLPLRAFAGIAAALRFYSKLPLPVFAFEPQPQPLIPHPAAVAVAGGLLGCCAAAVLSLAAAAGLPPMLASGLTVLALVVLTGALHEDGLADTADGLGGGWTPERRLEIMRDSRIGTYGASAVVLSLILRVSALATIASHYGIPAALAALVGAASLSRVAGLIPLWRLNPARSDGAGAKAARPASTSMLSGLVLSMAIAATLLHLSGIPPMLIALALALPVGASAFATWYAKIKIGGFTGDIAGAAQQAAEITLLLALCVGTA